MTIRYKVLQDIYAIISHFSIGHKKDKRNSNSGKAYNKNVILFIGFLMLFIFGNPRISFCQINDNPSPLTFPTPKGIRNQLFYLQRDPNINTIICQLNLNDKGQVNKEQPVNVFWMRYGDKAEKKELNYIQRKFAYGIQAKDLGNDQFELNFVSSKKLLLLLKKSTTGKYQVFTKVNNKNIQVDRIFLRIDGGTFWSPNVEYVQIEGVDVTTSNSVIERIKL